MKILKCILCSGEVDIISGDFSVNKKIKCQKCGFDGELKNKQATEVFVIRRKKN